MLAVVLFVETESEPSNLKVRSLSTMREKNGTTVILTYLRSGEAVAWTVMN